ncbi:MAG: hypothetical protein EBR82_00405 [Caulobacteraceae bacterium]|nr:hypothetical protein [Caulobacteraceae bacterium]
MKFQDSISNNIKRFSEGTLSSRESEQRFIPDQLPHFVRMVVLEVISDPTNDCKDEKRKTYWQSLGITNMKYADVLPRNTIIAKRVGENSDPLFVFPFFPSHLSLPCKPGEAVWTLLESPASNKSDVAYWFCRIIETSVADDVNHAHPSTRNSEISYFPTTFERHENESSINDSSYAWHELRNAPVVQIDDDRITSQHSPTLPSDDEDVFEKLVTSTDASRVTTYESVPRFRSRPGDVVLEGTNNTLVVLGTDRTGPLAEYSDPVTDLDRFSKTKIQVYPKKDIRGSAGSIDLVAGRGQTDETFGKSSDTTSIRDVRGKTKGSFIKKELNKSPDSLSIREGDPDLKNDRSRILISQRTNTDANFSLSDYNKDFSITDGAAGDASIILKSDKIRAISRSDVELISTGFNIKQSPDGVDIKEEINDADKWASLMLKQNGDVVVSTSKDRVFSVGQNKDAVDTSKALLTLDSGNNRFIAPLPNNGSAIIGSDKVDTALSVFDNSSNKITFGGGGAGALQVLDVSGKKVNIADNLAVFDASSNRVSIGGGAIVIDLNSSTIAIGGTAIVINASSGILSLAGGNLTLPGAPTPLTAANVTGRSSGGGSNTSISSPTSPNPAAGPLVTAAKSVETTNAINGLQAQIDAINTFIQGLSSALPPVATPAQAVNTAISTAKVSVSAAVSTISSKSKIT